MPSVFCTALSVFLRGTPEPRGFSSACQHVQDVTPGISAGVGEIYPGNNIIKQDESYRNDRLAIQPLGK